MPRIPTIAAALSAALAFLAPRAAPAGAAESAPPDGGGCAPMMAEWQGKEAATSAMADADLRAYNDIQNDVDHAAHLCEAGRDAEARAVMLRSKDPVRPSP